MDEGSTPKTAASAPAPKSARATRRAIARWARRIVLGLFGVGLVAALVIAWLPKPLTVDVAPVVRGAMRVTIDEDGRTRVKDRYVVSAPITGNVGRLELRPGDTIPERAILARIVPLAAPLLDARTRAELEARVGQAQAARMQAESGIARAEAALTLAQTMAARQRSLAAQGAASVAERESTDLEERARTEELTSTRFGARVAAHQVEMALAALGRTSGRAGSEQQLEVTSPTAGQVLRVIQQSEGVVAPGTPLVEVGDPAALEIVVDVLTTDAIVVRPGAHVEIDRWGGERVLRAHVRLVEPSAFTRVSALGVEEQRVNVVIDLDEPRERWAALGDGYRVEARIVVWDAANVLRVPASAVFRSGDGWAVFRVEGPVARLRSVEVGKRNGVDVEVLRGLAASDRVIAHPSDRVADGVEVVAR
jgi:HlyD family secretion protein